MVAEPDGRTSASFAYVEAAARVMWDEAGYFSIENVDVLGIEDNLGHAVDYGPASGPGLVRHP